eukprot:NODE_208_length_14728_cov_0.400164.p5 type:complete len:291 gc:universal NODE_208_length_14728_cov_0.400164:8204-9076(+)
MFHFTIISTQVQITPRNILPTMLFLVVFSLIIQFNKLTTLTVKGKHRQVYCATKGKTNRHAKLIYFFHGANENYAKFLSSYWYSIIPENTIVCAPKSEIGPGYFEWHLVLTDKKDDLYLMDSIRHDLKEKFDLNHIHLMGFSAGGIHAAHSAFLRSYYLKSVVIFSGGFILQQSYNVTNMTPSLIYNGGSNDSVAIVSFLTAGNRFISEAMCHNARVYACSHNEGHKIPHLAAKDALAFINSDPTKNVRLSSNCFLKQSSIRANSEMLKHTNTSSGVNSLLLHCLISLFF